MAGGWLRLLILSIQYVSELVVELPLLLAGLMPLVKQFEPVKSVFPLKWGFILPIICGMLWKEPDYCTLIDTERKRRGNMKISKSVLP